MPVEGAVRKSRHRSPLRERGLWPPFFLSIRSQLGSIQHRLDLMERMPEQERLARWLRNGEDYDDWEYGTEPIPGDHCWGNKKAPTGASELEDRQ